jgi:hypothetical protein
MWFMIEVNMLVYNKLNLLVLYRELRHMCMVPQGFKREGNNWVMDTSNR